MQMAWVGGEKLVGGVAFNLKIIETGILSEALRYQ